MLNIIDEVTHSGARVTAAVAGLTDADVRADSVLPGWSRGHVVTHVARAVDVYRWLLAVARTGVEPGTRAGSEDLARAVRHGAGRPAVELAADLHTGLGCLTEDAASMPTEAWDTLVTALAGWRHPAWYTLYRCWRELETHHVDLDIGYRTTDWPGMYVEWALDDTLAALKARDFPVARVEAVDLGRSWALSRTGPTIAASGHAVLGWLSGRTTNAPLADGRPLPDPPTWPLPPAPGWG